MTERAPRDVLLGRAKSTLEQLVRPTRATSEASDHLDQVALESLADVYIALGLRDALVELAPIRPISLRLAEFVADNPQPGFAGIGFRVKQEHQPSFERRLLVAVLLSRVDRQHEAALQEVLRLEPDTVEADARERLASLLGELADRVDGSNRVRADAAIQRLVGGEHRLVAQRKIVGLLRADSLSEAGSLLEEICDETDPNWLQLQGHYLLQTGKHAEAASVLRAAAELLPLPELLERAASVTIQYGRLEDAVTLLRRLVDAQADLTTARNNLAMALMRSGNLRAAAEEFRILAEADPAAYVTFHVRALALAERFDEAIEVATAAATTVQGSELVCLHAHLLWITGRAVEAFDLLHGRRPGLWRDELFVRTYQDICYASGHEEEASDALRQMIALRDAGDFPPEIVQEASIEDVLALQRQHDERRDMIAGKVLRGEMPWHLAARATNQSPYWDWYCRTQPLRWLPCSDRARAEHAIYASAGRCPAKWSSTNRR